MSNDKHDDPLPALAPEGFGLLLGGLLGGAMRYADAKEAQFVVCDDCARWDSPGRPPSPGCVRVGRCECDGHAYVAGGPLWPGCRGFKHKSGTPGPLARWKAVSAKQTEEAFERLRKAKAEMESDG